LWTALIDQNFSYEKTTSRLKSGSACYHLVQNLCVPICYPKIERLKYTEHCVVWVRNLVILREESRLNVFQNRVLRRIFGPKRDEVTGKWRRIHNEELYAMYHCDQKVRWMLLPSAIQRKGNHFQYGKRRVEHK